MSDQAISQILHEVESMPDGDAKIHLLSEAIRMADARNLIDDAFRARRMMMRIAAQCGHWEMKTLHFPWLLAKAPQIWGDAAPTFIVGDYISVVQSLPFYPQIPKAKIFQAQQELLDLIKQSYHGESKAHHIFFLNAGEMGNFELAEEWRLKLEAEHYIPTAQVNGYQHERYCRGWHFAQMGKHNLALYDWEKVMRNWGGSTIHRAYSHGFAIGSMLRIGKTIALANAARVAIRLVRGKKGLLEPYSEVILFLARTHNWKELTALLPEFMGYAEVTTSPFEQFQAFRALATAMISLQQSGLTHFQQSLPLHHPMSGTSPTLLSLQTDYQLRAAALAQRFDDRNENQWFHSRLADAMDLAQFHPFPIQVSR